ncbi:MAG: GPP34 family phosphoprotein [Jatrophihabitans sp.]
MSDSLGVTICRLSLDPVRGRIRHPMQVGIAIRAAMFVDLALSGRLVGQRWPEAIGSSDLDDPLLNAVHRAVSDRAAAPWRRWYSHVDADREAAVTALTTSGRWQRTDRRILDSDPGSTVVDQQRFRQLYLAGEVPDDLETAVVALLLGGAGGVGWPTPRRTRRLAKQWLPPHLMKSGRAGDAVLSSLLAAMATVRRSSPIPLLYR